MGSGSWSKDPEDLSDEPLLSGSPKFDLDGTDRPSIGRYVLLSKLGQGGMGVVYHATHETLGNEVAIKLLPRGTRQAEEELLARFRREARLAAQLRSPHLVSVLDIAADEPSRCHFIVMEYVHGLSGSDWLKRHAGRAPEAEALDVCIAATRGLDAAHRQGIVHRDIKPGNILIPFDAHGRPDPSQAKLCDLGLARSDAGVDEITRTQVMMGTPGYMAPEQAESARRAKKPADVLGMGATLFKFLTGRAPLVDPSTEEWLRWTLLAKHPDPRELRPDISPATVELLETCLRLEAAERFSDAAALVAALEVCRESIESDMEATTFVGNVRSISTRSEQGLPVLSDSPVATEVAAPPPAPGTEPPHQPLAAGQQPGRAATSPVAEPRPKRARRRKPQARKPNRKRKRNGPHRMDADAARGPRVRRKEQRKPVREPSPSEPTSRKSRAPLLLVSLLFAAATGVYAWAPWTSTLPDSSLALLRDLRRWDTATSHKRRRAAEAVDRAMAHFKLSRLESFSVGGQHHEMAIFDHSRTDLEFVLIPVGQFQMGSPKSEASRDDDEGQHRVTLTTPFLIATTECTQAAWDAVGGDDLRRRRGRDLPIESVSWDAVMRWCSTAGLRLPSESEWEYACRAGTTTSFNVGGELKPTQANYLDSVAIRFANPDLIPRTLDAGSSPPNAFGLADMHGNVWEWCTDVFASYPKRSVTDPLRTGMSETRVIRGGGYATPVNGVRAANRHGDARTGRSPDRGFRPAQSVPSG